MPDTKLPRYTPALVADPTPPLPHAAPAPATVADVAMALLMASNERARAEAAEAERDRLSAELAAARLVAAKATNALQGAAKGSAGAFDIIAADADRQRARAERAEAEAAALRGAWEEVSRAANKIQDWDGTRLGDAMEAMEAALATAAPTPPAAVPRPDLERARILADDHDSANVDPESDGSDYTAATIRALCDYIDAIQPTPPAAEAVTVWTREAPTEPGEYWAIVDRWSEPAPQMVSLKVAESGDTWWESDSYDDTYGYSPRQILLWGPIAVTLIPPGWREALAALDTPQEADHAR